MRKEVQEGIPYALLAYLSILCIIPLIIKKDNAFVLFHTKQGIVLFVCEIAVSIISVIPLLGWLIGFFGMLLFGIISLIGIIKVLTGEYWKIPVVSDYAEKIQI